MMNIESTHSEGDRARQRAYLKEFIPGIVGYMVVLLIVLLAVDAESSGAWVWMLLPMIPCLWIIRAVARDLGRADEYTRLRQLEAMAAGFGVAMAVSLTLGFLGVAGVATRAAGWIPYSAGMATWGITLALRFRSEQGEA